MSIIWCGGEPGCFPNGGVAAIDTSTSAYRSAYSRCAVMNSSTTIKSVTFSAITSAWLTAQIFCNPTGGTYLIPSIGFGKSGTNSGLFVGTSATNQHQFALLLNSAGVITQLAVESGNSLLASTLLRMDMQLVNYGATSTVNVFVNGLLLISYSGSTAISGVANFDQVWIYPFGSGAVTKASEVMVASDDTRSRLALRSAPPNGAGDTNVCTNNAYTVVNVITPNDANAEYSNAAGDAQHALTDLPAGIFTVEAVKVSARASHTAGSAVSNIALGFKSGGSVGAGSHIALTANFVDYEQIFATNPATGLAWGDATEMNALQVDAVIS